MYCMAINSLKSAILEGVLTIIGSIHEEATVDVDGLAGDVSRIVAGEKECALGYIFGLAAMTDGYRGFERVVLRRRPWRTQS